MEKKLPQVTFELNQEVVTRLLEDEEGEIFIQGNNGGLHVKLVGEPATRGYWMDAILKMTLESHGQKSQVGYVRYGGIVGEGGAAMPVAHPYNPQEAPYDTLEEYEEDILDSQLLQY